MDVRKAQETVRRLDQWAEYVPKLEAARQCSWKEKLLSSRARLAFTLDDMESDRARIRKTTSTVDGRPAPPPMAKTKEVQGKPKKKK